MKNTLEPIGEILIGHYQSGFRNGRRDFPNDEVNNLILWQQ